MPDPRIHGPASGGVETAARTTDDSIPSPYEVVMPNLKITGLAQETDFADPTKTATILIIDKGAVRLRIYEESVQDLLQYAIADSPAEDPIDFPSETNGHVQAAEREEEEELTPPPADEDGSTDEAGIPQI